MNPVRRIILTLLTLLSMQGVAHGELDLTQYRKDLDSIANEPRTVGSIGYFHAVGYLEKQIASLPNVEVRRQEFPVLVPVTRQAAIYLPDSQQPQPIYPFWPAHIRLNSTPEQGITGRLVYVGRARYEEIRPNEIRGQIAVIEASAGTYWTNAAYFGARAILVLGSPDTTNFDLRSHDLLVPVNLPRFYVPPGQLAEQLRSGKVTGNVTLKAAVDWERKTAVNLYALIRANSLASETGEYKNSLRKGQENPSSPGALMISVPFDAGCLVPDLAYGASQAAQAAAGLALVRDLSVRPLNRPVVVFFSGADSIQMLATRNMFLALSDLPGTWDKELGELAEKQRVAKEDAKTLRGLVEEPARIDPSKNRSQIDRIVRLIETDIALEQDELFRLRRVEATPASRSRSSATRDAGVATTREQELAQRQIRLNQLRFSFMQRPAALAGDLDADARHYISKTIAQLNGTESKPGLIQQQAWREHELRQRVDLYNWLSDRLGKKRDPTDRSNQNRLIELLVALDLTDQGVRCGPMYFGRYINWSNISQIQDYRDWFTRRLREFQGKTGSAWWAEIDKVIDLEPLSGSRAAPSWLGAHMPIASELCQAWGVPGFSMITLDDLRLRRDTPTDTLANLNVDAIWPQLVGTRELLGRAWNDPNFIGQPDLKWQRTQVVGQVVTTAAGRPVPDLPRGDFLVTYWQTADMVAKFPKLALKPWSAGNWVLATRRNEVRDCDAEGNYRFEGLSRLGEPSLPNSLAIEAFQVRPATGEITGSTDLGRQSADIKFYADLKIDLDPWRSVVFPCEELSLVGLYDPRFLQSLGELILLDARRNAEPQRYNALLYNQHFAAFVEPGSRNHFLFRYGRVGNRLILINADQNRAERNRVGDDFHRSLGAVEGRGYTTDELRSIGPLNLATARDFYHLDDKRLRKYREAGVSSTLVDDLHAQSRKQIDDASAAQQHNRGADMASHANGAWANSARVYSAAADMANDVVRGAIFLLLLCVPFAFCMERLLIGTANIYRQIAGAFAIFTVMTIALWSFHPAFAISSSALIILLAFAIIFMSSVVMFVVYGKFDTELKRIRSGRAISDGASFARSSVLASAVLLGIANMRRRKFRTLLTSITIVLITFAVLCFTSATRYLDTTTLPTGVASSHPGIMLRQRGFRPLPLDVVDNLRPLLPGKKLVQRWWNTNAGDPREQMHLVAGAPGEKPRVFGAAALLGLSPGESELSPAISQVIGAEKFARLERGERDVIYLSDSVAQTLAVKENDTIRLGGIPVTIAGIYSAQAFDDRVKTLSGEPLAPLKYQPGGLDAGGQKLSEATVEALDLDGSGAGAELSSAYEHLPSTQFAIIPAALSQILPNASLRSVAVRLADGAPSVQSDAIVKEASDELAKRFAVAMFAGFSEGVRMVSASNLASVSGAGQVAIPLAIAGLIIFNTMMGSIAERKREIHIYTSLGLAPMHVGALFVAEAMTYGLIGTVFGYIIGQGVGTLLLRLGWLGNVTLNYSGTSAIMTMGLILLIVLLSALVPARLASQLAAPSIERSWKVPLPKNDEIMANLPFTINKTAADGALAYLAEYFDAHQEGSIGKFSSGKIDTFAFTDEQGRVSRGIKTLIWLTPYDLGVRQHLMLLIHPGEFPDIYEVQVILQRLSGDDGSWYRMNRPFLTDLRKQFLQWRSLAPGRMMQYVQDSQKLFNSDVSGTDLNPALST